MSRRPVVPLSFTRHGDASRPAVILLQGLGMASNAWPAELVDALVETGMSRCSACGENARAQEGFGCLRS